LPTPVKIFTCSPDEKEKVASNRGFYPNARYKLLMMKLPFYLKWLEDFMWPFLSGKVHKQGFCNATELLSCHE
jgi:hypothetical protein